MSPERFPVHPNTVPDQTINPLAARVHETFSGDEGAVSLAGIGRAITEWRLRRNQRILDELIESAEVHQVAAAMQLVPGRPEDPDPATEASLVSQDHRTAELYQTTHTPVSISQQHQALRASYRRRKNMRAAVSNYNSEKIYNDGDRRIGTQAHIDTLEGERKPWWLTHEAKKADKKYRRNTATIAYQTGLIERSRDGDDIPGYLLDKRIERKQAKHRKLQSRLRR